jgi:uncharacterized protein (DUF58 family)
MKNELSAELAAVLAYAAVKNNDKVGLIIFSDIIEKFIPPKKGRNPVWRVIREVLEHSPLSKKTDIAAALDFLNRITSRRVIAFLLSDFMARNYEKLLRITNKKHDLIAISITDPREREIPPVGLVELADAETGEKRLIDAGEAGFRREFSARAARQEHETREIFRRCSVDHIPLITDQPYINALMKFFRMREKRM